MGDGLMKTSGGEVLGFLGLGLLLVFLILADYGILLTICFFGGIEFLYCLKLSYDLIKRKKAIIAIIGMIVLIGSAIYGYFFPPVIMKREFSVYWSSLASVLIPSLIYGYVASALKKEETFGEMTWTRVIHLIIAGIIGFVIAFGIGMSDKATLEEWFDSDSKIEDVREKETSSVETINKCFQNLYEAEKQSYPDKTEEEVRKIMKSDLKSENYLNNRLGKYYYSVEKIEEESENTWIFYIEDENSNKVSKYRVDMQQFKIIEEIE